MEEYYRQITVQTDNTNERNKRGIKRSNSFEVTKCIKNLEEDARNSTFVNL